MLKFVSMTEYAEMSIEKEPVINSLKEVVSRVTERLEVLHKIHDRLRTAISPGALKAINNDERNIHDQE